MADKKEPTAIELQEAEQARVAKAVEAPKAPKDEPKAAPK